MRQESMDEAGTKLTRLVEADVQGGTVGAALYRHAAGAGLPACSLAGRTHRLHAMEQDARDVDAMGREEIAALFEGRSS